MIKSKQEGNVLTLTNNSVLVPIIVAVVALVVALYLFSTEQTMTGIIVGSVGLIGLLFIRTQKYIFDLGKGTLDVDLKSLFRKTSMTTELSEIARLRVASRQNISTDSEGRRRKSVTYIYFLDLNSSGNIKLAEMSPTLTSGMLGMNEQSLPKSMKKLIEFLNIPVEIEREPTLAGAIKAVRDTITDHNRPEGEQTL